MADIAELIAWLDATDDDEDTRLAERLRAVAGDPPAPDDFAAHVADSDAHGGPYASVSHSHPGGGGGGGSEGGPGSAVRHVTLEGDDTDDGLTWGTAKRSVAAAVRSLPITGSAANEHRHEGVVKVGQGKFVEMDLPIPLRAQLAIVGQHSSQEFGTIIEAGTDAHLFDYNTADFGSTVKKGIAHQIRLEKMALRGGAQGPESDLVRIRSGGFNTVIRDVAFGGAGRFGLDVEHSAVTVFGYNLTFTNCGSAAIHTKFTQDANFVNLKFWGTQIDNCGPVAPIQLEAIADGGANIVSFDGLEVEAFNAGQHETAVILVDHVGGANSLTVNVREAGFFKSGDPGVAAVYEVNADQGPRGFYNLHTVVSDKYTDVFRSDRSGFVAGQQSVKGLLMANAAGVKIFKP